MGSAHGSIGSSSRSSGRFARRATGSALTACLAAFCLYLQVLASGLCLSHATAGVDAFVGAPICHGQVGATDDAHGGGGEHHRQDGADGCPLCVLHGHAALAIFSDPATVAAPLRAASVENPAPLASSHTTRRLIAGASSRGPPIIA